MDDTSYNADMVQLDDQETLADAVVVVEHQQSSCRVLGDRRDGESETVEKGIQMQVPV